MLKCSCTQMLTRSHSQMLKCSFTQMLTHSHAHTLKCSLKTQLVIRVEMFDFKKIENVLSKSLRRRGSIGENHFSHSSVNFSYFLILSKTISNLNFRNLSSSRLSSSMSSSCSNSSSSSDSGCCHLEKSFKIYCLFHTLAL